ncbi:hypothetical protein J2X72_003057 [Phyllobacterium sp. 1468]|nr:hypothetical protein [Phyllobacterium sp. 1468]
MSAGYDASGNEIASDEPAGKIKLNADKNILLDRTQATKDNATSQQGGRSNRYRWWWRHLPF